MGCSDNHAVHVDYFFLMDFFLINVVKATHPLSVFVMSYANGIHALLYLK